MAFNIRYICSAFILAYLVAFAVPEKLMAQVQFIRSGTNLFIIGTSGYDNVSISNVNDLTTNIRVRDYATSPATARVFNGVENVFIALGAGENVVQTLVQTTSELIPLTISGSLEVHSTSGLDRMYLGGITVGGDCLLSLGDGGSTIEIGNTLFLGNLTVITGTGDDRVNSGVGWSTAYGEAQGNVSFQLGDGADYVNMTSFECAGELVVDGQGGTDVIRIENGANNRYSTFGAISLYGGSGSDAIFVDDTTIYGNLAIDSGNNNDTIQITSNVFVAGSAEISSGSHIDDILISEFHANRITVSCGGGNDHLELDHCSCSSSLAIDLEGGADVLFVRNTTTITSYINGGNGNDFGSQFTSALGRGSIFGFETGNMN